MRHLLATLALAAFSTTVLWATSARAEDDWAQYVVAKGVNDGKQLTVTFEGVKGYYFNTQYPTKLLLTAPDGVKLGKNKLGKGDAKFSDTVPGKAKKATFTTSASKDAPIAVEYKIVVCSETNCSPPFKGSLTAK